ncbi:MAG: LolA family protein [Candidatus Sumerlaeota bacterium]
MVAMLLTTAGFVAAQEPYTSDTLQTSPTLTTPTLPVVREILDDIEEKHSDIKSLIIDFRQVKIWEEFGDEIESNGRLLLQKPMKLRCEYFQPDPSVILFVDDAFYQYTPKLKQVDKFVYESEEEAEARFRLLMLGFGISGEQILQNYHVSPAPAWDTDSEDGNIVLDFIPTNPGIRKITKSIRVWFDRKTLIPKQIRIEEVSADVIGIYIKDYEVNAEIEEKHFKAEWPRGTKVLEH